MKAAKNEIFYQFRNQQISKKAQISIFLIIGAVILIAAAVIFYITTSQEREEIVPGVFIAVQEIPTELDPVSKFVTSCLDDVSTRGLRLIGEHGGYIDPDDFELTKQSFTIRENPTESDAVIFAPNGNLKVPYWFYLKSSNTCTGTCAFTSKRPNLREGENSIKAQLDRYIEKELHTCIDNFESLQQQGFVIKELSPVKSDARIAEQDIVVILNYELEVIKGDVTSNIEQFFVRIPLNLQKIYNLATEITNLQQQYRFLERQTMNLISAFAAVDENKLPPITDMRFELGSTTNWRKSDVKEKISQILTSYIALFQVDGARNYNRDLYSSELKQKLYDSMIIPVADPQYNDIDVTFNYLDFWPIFFDLNCNGEICEPESASSNILSFIGLQRYNFVYDVSFPTLVEIFDESALNNRGFKFNFFLESNIRNNKELESEFVPLEAVSVPKASFLCDLDNRNSADVIIKAIDTISSKPLKDVSVTLSVIDQSCYIGKTNENGTLVTKFPLGTAGAVVSLLKPEYISKSELFDARRDQESLIETKLDPILDKKIVVKKRLLEKTDQGWSLTNKISDLSPNEEAIVTLTRLSPLTEEEFTTIANVQGSNIEELRIAPGTYEVNINMLLREALIIPERTVRTGLFDEVTLPSFQFDKDNPYPSGGLKLNVLVTEKDLSKDTIVFFAISPALQNVPQQNRRLEDLEQASKIEEYSKVFSSILTPIFQ